MSIARQRPVKTFPRQPKRATAATNTHGTVEELLEAVFSIWSLPRLYNENSRPKCLTVTKIWSWAPEGGLTPGLADRLTVCSNVTLALTLVLRHETG
jgi:hypothetical protein